MNTASSQLTLETIYKEVLGDYANHKEFLWKHRGRFVHYIQSAVANSLLEPRFSRKYFKLEKLSYALDPDRDELLVEKDVTSLATDHLLKEADRIIETPQYFWMRLAMTRCFNEPNPTRAALALYNQLSLNPQTRNI